MKQDHTNHQEEDAKSKISDFMTKEGISVPDGLIAMSELIAGVFYTQKKPFSVYLEFLFRVSKDSESWFENKSR